MFDHPAHSVPHNAPAVPSGLKLRPKVPKRPFPPSVQEVDNIVPLPMLSENNTQTRDQHSMLPSDSTKPTEDDSSQPSIILEPKWRVRRSHADVDLGLEVVMKELFARDSAYAGYGWLPGCLTAYSHYALTCCCLATNVIFAQGLEVVDYEVADMGPDLGR